MNKMVIAKYNGRYLEGYFNEDKLMDLRIYGEKSVLNNIYIGKVMDIVPNLDACFINYGGNDTCFYSFCDNASIVLNRQNADKIKPGDELLVQIVKEPIKTKKAVASSKLTLKGEYCLVNYGGEIGVSSKIISKNTRMRLKDIAEKSLPDDFGCIIRTKAETADEAVISEEIKNLADKLKKIIDRSRHRTCYSCLYRAQAEYVDSFIGKSRLVDKVISDDIKVIEDIREYCAQAEISHAELTYYQDDTLSLMTMYDMKKQLDSATKSKVWLKSGGYLVIEQTEALSVIDVNTGKAVKGKDTRENFLKINKEAACEACRQLRLRNLSGIIIIDFINMTSFIDMEEVTELLKEELTKDFVPASFVDITKLGLVELTRKKIHPSLSEEISHLNLL